MYKKFAMFIKKTMSFVSVASIVFSSMWLPVYADETNQFVQEATADVQENETYDSVESTPTINDLKIGDYIQFGRYNDEPILWRYAADDEYGKLIFSDKIIDLKEYHVKSTNYWKSSNIRAWLNSKAPSLWIDWLGQKRPPYLKEPGFLSDNNFSASERVVIKKVWQKTLLDQRNEDMADGGSFDLWIGEFLSDINYKEIIYFNLAYDLMSYEYTDDMIFLIDFKQLYNIIQNANILGEEFVYPQISNYIKSNIDPQGTRYFYYYTRNPYNYRMRIPNDPFSYKPYTRPSGMAMYSVTPHPSGDISTYPRLYSEYVTRDSGIRPAFYLNENNTQILSGDGTEYNPYIITGITVPEDENDGALPRIDRIYENPYNAFININGQNYPFYYYQTKGTLKIIDNSMYMPLHWIDDILSVFYSPNDYSFSTPKYIYNDEDAYELNYYNFSTCRSCHFKHLVPGKNTFVAEEVLYAWDKAPFCEDDILYLPLRCLVEHLGGTIEWDDSSRIAYITIQ